MNRTTINNNNQSVVNLVRKIRQNFPMVPCPNLMNARHVGDDILVTLNLMLHEIDSNIEIGLTRARLIGILRRYVESYERNNHPGQVSMQNTINIANRSMSNRSFMTPRKITRDGTPARMNVLSLLEEQKDINLVMYVLNVLCETKIEIEKNEKYFNEQIIPKYESIIEIQREIQDIKDNVNLSSHRRRMLKKLDLAKQRKQQLDDMVNNNQTMAKELIQLTQEFMIEKPETGRETQ